MFSLLERTTLETEVEETDTRYGFTWVFADGKYRIRSPDDRFKQVPEVVVETMREKSTELSIDELIAETERHDSGAAAVLREMDEKDFVRDGAPVERVRPPEDIRLWHRALGVGLLLCLTGALWVATASRLAGPFLDHPIRYLLDSAPVLIPMVICSVVVHELGHYHTARKQGLDPSFGVSILNGVIPAVVTRTHGGWVLPRNRRMWNTLAGPAYGLLWTLGMFALYYTLWPHPGVAVAGLLCFNLQVAALNPLIHGDGYLLMTDLLDERNVRTRGITDLKERRPTWQAAYAAVSYGFAIVGFAVNLAVGYLVGDVAGSLAVLCVLVVIYAESYFGIVERFRTVRSASGR
ncbi:M50 family metallopeptidase (plasmid) [Halorussus salilacus]|uniref:M50 family metallopeptidase n=1 Tax=Halorussus salilacus TaxID=2953750 RepID=UPI0020A00006|nr:M50 family metallopeptidase [Halorussus salilacus]USZ69951.1 M50 family metallopeptidase [Halorussus salilacus]